MLLDPDVGDVLLDPDAGDVLLDPDAGGVLLDPDVRPRGKGLGEFIQEEEEGGNAAQQADDFEQGGLDRLDDPEFHVKQGSFQLFPEELNFLV